MNIITSVLFIKILVQVRGILFLDHLEEAECRSEQGGDGRRNLKEINIGININRRHMGPTMLSC